MATRKRSGTSGSSGSGACVSSCSDFAGCRLMRWLCPNRLCKFTSQVFCCEEVSTGAENPCAKKMCSAVRMGILLLLTWAVAKCLQIPKMVIWVHCGYFLAMAMLSILFQATLPPNNFQFMTTRCCRFFILVYFGIAKGLYMLVYSTYYAYVQPDSFRVWRILSNLVGSGGLSQAVATNMMELAGLHLFMLLSSMTGHSFLFYLAPHSTWIFYSILFLLILRTSVLLQILRGSIHFITLSWKHPNAILRIKKLTTNLNCDYTGLTSRAVNLLNKIPTGGLIPTYIPYALIFLYCATLLWISLHFAHALFLRVLGAERAAEFGHAPRDKPLSANE